MPDDQDHIDAAALLDHAIDFLADPAHWNQGSWASSDGRSRCIIATLSDAAGTGSNEYRSAPFQIALRSVTAQLDCTPDGPFLRDWNDDPRTSHEDLMLTLKRARATLP